MICYSNNMYVRPWVVLIMLLGLLDIDTSKCNLNEGETSHWYIVQPLETNIFNLIFEIEKVPESLKYIKNQLNSIQFNIFSNMDTENVNNVRKRPHNNPGSRLIKCNQLGYLHIH